ncbi:MAG: hypothetical protein L3J14_08015 [Flavobacteriaceae bacterium]|nr:hypothetical protein [Flavobacteriaceae bacterium]
MSIQKNDLTDNRVFGIVERFIAIFLVFIPLILFYLTMDVGDQVLAIMYIWTIIMCLDCY